jgi:hypothetical protein
MGIERIIDPKERERAHAEVGYVDFYSEAVKQSEEFRQEYGGYLNVVKSAEMPLERSLDAPAETDARPTISGKRRDTLVRYLR